MFNLTIVATFGHCKVTLHFSDPVGWASGRASSLLSDEVGVGVVICLERGADCLHTVQQMPLHPKTPSSLAEFNPDW